MLFKRIIQNQKKVESLCITCIMYSQFVIIDSPTSCLFSRMSYMANYYIPPSTSQMEFLYRTAAYLWKYRISAVKQILSSCACQFNFSYKLFILLSIYAINKSKEPEEIGYRLRNFFNIHLYFKYLFLLCYLWDSVFENNVINIKSKSLKYWRLAQLFIHFNAFILLPLFRNNDSDKLEALKMQSIIYSSFFSSSHESLYTLTHL